MKKALKYFSYLCGEDENSIVKQAFLVSKQLDMENRKSYISELKTHLRETGCYDLDTLGFVRQSTIARTIKNLENSYIFWQSEINSEKLDFCRIYKQGFHTSN